MGQHATIHGKNSTPVNGASGSWIPISVNSQGQVDISALAGEDTTLDRLAGGAISGYTQINTATTTVLKTGAGLFYGIVVTTGVAGNVTVYDNTAASGTILVPATSVAATGAVSTGFPSGVGIKYTTGLTIVTSGTATILVLWA